MNRILVAITKHNKFIEAAYCAIDNNSDDIDRYVRLCERKYGLNGLSLQTNGKAKGIVPNDYKPRLFVPTITKQKRYKSDIITMYKKAHDSDDGVNYEE